MREPEHYFDIAASAGGGAIMRSCRALALIAAGLMAAGAHAGSPRTQGEIHSAMQGAMSHVRPISARELTEVRDLSSLALAPDSSVAVVRLHEPSIERNDVVLSWYVVPLRPAGPARKVASAGDPDRNDAGLIDAEAPQWSSDSTWFYYRALTGTQMQLWRTRRDGSATQKLTDDPADIEAFKLDSQHERVFYVVGATREAISRAERAEYERGVIYDETVSQTSGRVVNNKPYRGRMATRRRTANNGYVSALGPVSPRVKVLDLTSGNVHDATEQELAAYEQLTAPLQVQSEPRAIFAHQAVMTMANAATTRSGAVVFLAPAELADTTLSPKEAILKRMATPPRYQVRWAESAQARESNACTAPVCLAPIIRLGGVAWRPGTNEILIAASGPNGSSEASLYAWDTKRSVLRTVTSGGTFSPDERIGVRVCPIAHDQAICITAAAAQPPRLQSIDLQSGVRRTLFDPNGELRQNRFGPVEVLSWQDAGGREFHGYLLLPAAATPRKLPLVITTYWCGGFLRGGVGDEYPEHLFAAAGFAVLCANTDHERTVAQGADGKWLPVAGMKDNVSGWEAAIDLLARRGLVDPQRVGISGLSYGARNTLYAISHSNRFAAASTSSGSDLDPYAAFLSIAPGSMGEAIRGLEGLPPPLDDPQGIWRQVSPALNADQISAALLVQVADAEFDVDLRGLNAHMRHAAKPIEIVVFPDETHQKWQPVHKLAAYERNLDWFRFWLQGYENPDPARRGQCERWRKLKELRNTQ